MEKLKDFFETYPKAKILDVGTGRGNFVALITEVFDDYEKIVGIDILPRAIELASQHFKGNERIKFVERDILNTGFPEEHFDIVCLANSLHHLDKMQETFNEMEKLLKPGGSLIIFEMRADELNDKQISHKLLHHFAAKIDRELGRVHGETYSKADIVKLVENTSSLTVDKVWQLEYEQPEINEYQVKQIASQVDMLLNQIKDEETKKKFQSEADVIKKYILELGFDSCPSIIVTLKKR